MRGVHREGAQIFRDGDLGAGSHPSASFLPLLQFLPMLQRALEFGGAPPIALSAVLKIGNTLEGDEFQARVIPIVTKLFTSQARGS
jgi:hypothetical protein